MRLQTSLEIVELHIADLIRLGVGFLVWKTNSCWELSSQLKEKFQSTKFIFILSGLWNFTVYVRSFWF